MDFEPKTVCPYNSAHHILEKRLGTHLVKCRKNYPNTNLELCHFNSNHRIPQPELQYHHSVCPNRFKVEAAIYQEEGTDLSKFPISTASVEVEESWDDENVTSYDPKTYCEQRGVLRHKDVAPPSERKEFRNQERRRLQEINTLEPSSQMQETSSIPPPGISRPKPSQSTVETAAKLMQKINLNKK